MTFFFLCFGVALGMVNTLLLLVVLGEIERRR